MRIRPGDCPFSPDGTNSPPATWPVYPDWDLGSGTLCQRLENDGHVHGVGFHDAETIWLE